MKDYTLISIAYNNEARIYVTRSTNLVEEARKIHKTWPTASAALGRFLTASVMMGLMQKDHASLTLKIQCDGPIEFLQAEVDDLGNVKGDLGNPEIYFKYDSGPNQGKLNVGLAIGNGTLHVTKDLHMKNLFSSSSPLVSGEIAEDFTYYFAVSEQTPSAVALGVLVETDNSIKQAGGFIIQLLPGASEQTIAKIENIISDIPSITTLLEEGQTPEEITTLISNNTHKILAKKSIQYFCDCSKERFSDSLYSLNLELLTQLRDEDHGAEIICNFCHIKYQFTKKEIDDLIVSKQLK